MSITAKQLRPYVYTMEISSEAKAQLAEALASQESFIIQPAGHLAREMSKTFRVVQLSQRDFDVIVPPRAAAPLKQLFESAETPGANFHPMLIVHPDEPEPIPGTLELKQGEKGESKLIRTWWPNQNTPGTPDTQVGFWRRNRDWELNLMAETLEKYPDSAVVEERTGYHCQRAWEIKVWRLKDGSILENPSGHSVIGCYEIDEDVVNHTLQYGGDAPLPNNKSHFEIRSEVVRGLVVRLCPMDFVEVFPELAAAMGRPETESR